MSPRVRQIWLLTAANLTQCQYRRGYRADLLSTDYSNILPEVASVLGPDQLLQLDPWELPAEVPPDGGGGVLLGVEAPDDDGAALLL